MHKRLITIYKYYVNLEYNECKKNQALIKISALSKKIKFKDVNDVSERFLETASVIQENLSLFQSACGHVDTVTTICEYLMNFGVKFMLGSESEEEYNRDEIIMSVILTIFNICKEREVQLFLEDTIVQNSTLDKIRYQNLKTKLLNQTNEIILLEDSDLHAVINYLMKTEISRLNEIWVQEAIKQKFLFYANYIEKFIHHNEFPPVRTFQSELHIPRELDNMNIISIWSENVIAAKDLATFLDKDVIFINAHMDLCGGIVLLPYVKVFDNMYKGLKCNFDDSIMKPSVNEVKLSWTPNMRSFPVYSLFYSGQWQKPVKETYWKHDKSLWANATKGDIEICVMSAEQGFKIWSIESTISRKKVLLKLSSILECNGKFPLVEIMTKWQNLPYVIENSILCTENEKLEVTNTRKPRGIIILKENNENELFYRLAQILIAGNCVIVISDAKSFNLAPYCDMFTTSGIPSGVINFLTHENISNLELSLCATDYANYAKQLFSDSSERTYVNLTVSKQIILPLK